MLTRAGRCIDPILCVTVEEEKEAVIRAAEMEDERSYRASIHAMQVQEALIQQAVMTGQVVGSPLRAAKKVAAEMAARAAKATERESFVRSQSPDRKSRLGGVTGDKFALQEDLDRTRRRLAALSDLDGVKASQAPGASSSMPPSGAPTSLFGLDMAEDHGSLMTMLGADMGSPLEGGQGWGLQGLMATSLPQRNLVELGGASAEQGAGAKPASQWSALKQKERERLVL